MNYALDTNLLVRLLTRDDEKQYAKVVRLLTTQEAAQTPVLLTLGVLLESEWVLRSHYGLMREQIRTAFGALLETPAVVVESPATLEEALMLFGNEPAADFADCLHVARARQYGVTLATFDRGAARVPGAGRLR